MADPSLAVQKAIFQRLQAELPDLSVTDSVEVAGFEDALPFVLIGDDDFLDGQEHANNEFTIRSYLHCHAAGPSRADVKTLANQVRAAMAGEFSIPNFQCLVTYHEGTQTRLIEGIAHRATVTWTFELFEIFED